MDGRPLSYIGDFLTHRGLASQLPQSSTKIRFCYILIFLSSAFKLTVLIGKIFKQVRNLFLCFTGQRRVFTDGNIHGAKLYND